MNVITTFDHMESSFHKDLCPTVEIEYEAHYDADWVLVKTNIISIHEVSQSGDKRESVGMKQEKITHLLKVTLIVILKSMGKI